MTRTERVSGEEFRDIYGSLGDQDAAGKDEESLSFLYELSERVWLLLLDANTEDAPGRIKDSTMQWAERQMKRAEETGASIITVTHQNVLAQNKLLSQGFLLDHHEEMNRNYFAGMTKPEKEVTDTEGWKLWKEKGAELFFGKYMDSMLEDAGWDENKLKIVRDLRP